MESTGRSTGEVAAPASYLEGIMDISISRHDDGRIQIDAWRGRRVAGMQPDIDALGREETVLGTLAGATAAEADEITEALTQWLGEEAMESARVEAEAVREAAACCGGSDCGWQEAGYASAVAAAEALVDVPRSDPRLRERTIELVAAHLERMEARR